MTCLGESVQRQGEDARVVFAALSRKNVSRIMQLQNNPQQTLNMSIS